MAPESNISSRGANGKVQRKLSSFLPPNLSVDGLYASLRHGSLQRPIAWSCKNVALVPSWVPDRKVPGLMNPSLRTFSLLMGAGGKAKLWDTCMEDISVFHGQSHLTHVLWNPSGNYFTTIDEKGKIVIWANKRYLNAWLPAYMVRLFAPVVCCEWINPERMYVASKTDGSTKYERERSGRPRSPMALVVLTADGQLTTVYKPAAGMYMHNSTGLPRRSATEDLASARITHGSMQGSPDGIQLVTHTSNVLPSTVNVYHIDLRFTPEVVFRCDALAILHISNPLRGSGSVMMPGSVLHLKLLPQTATKPYSVAVALASREETPTGEITYRSQVVVWDVTPKVMGFHPAFQELSTRRNDAVSGQPSLAFVMLGERRFENKFVSALNVVPRSRELVVGFSDGSVLGLESRFSGLQDSTLTLLDGFRTEKSDSPVVAISPSPNGINLLFSSLSGKLSTVYTSETTGYDLDLEAAIQYAVVALLNDSDYSDIVGVIVKATRISGDDQLPDRFLEGIFKSYESIKGAEDSSMLEPFLPKASVMRRMLSLQLVLFQALPSKMVQYRATNALLHLQSIGEVFSGCCTSDPSTLAAHLDSGTTVTASASGPGGPKALAFDTSSLWSLFPLCGWVLDFCTILFRELAVFLNMRTRSTSVMAQSVSEGQAPNPANAAAATPAPSLLCFLYHSRARKTLRSVLVLVEQYYQYVRIREQLYQRVCQTAGPIEAPTVQGQEKVNNHTNSMTILEAVAMKEVHVGTLSQYVESTFTRCPIKVGGVKSMLKDLNGIGSHVDLSRMNGSGASTISNGNAVLDKTAADHLIFIRGLVPSFISGNSLAQAKMELRMVTRRYPTLWDMNRLIFATIHWLDLEPADILTASSSLSSKAVSRQRAHAMHPARCRIDPNTALKGRTFGPGGIPMPSSNTPGGGSARVALPPIPYGSALQHYGSNVSMSNMSVGSRGSISSASGKGVISMGLGMGIGGGSLPSKVFTESPGELSLAQQASRQLRHPSMLGSGGAAGPGSFPDAGAASSAMTTNGSVSHRMGGGVGLLDAAHLSMDMDSIWGMRLDETDEDDGNEEKDDEGGEDCSKRSDADRQDDFESVKATWQNWSPSLDGQQQHAALGHGLIQAGLLGNDDGAVAGTVPDDDMLLEEEGDEEDEDRDSDDEMQDPTVLNNNNNSTSSHSARRDSKGDVGILRRRRSSLATLAPSSHWLLQESRAISKRTQSEWTVFPVLSEARFRSGGIALDGHGPSAGVEAGEGMMRNTSRLAALGLGGHFAPADLMAPITTAVESPHQSHVHSCSQSEIELQVRKRRFGVEPIRKVKKYKTTGHGRRCIRCHQISTTNVGGKPSGPKRPPVPHQIGASSVIIPDIASGTLWYHNYDRSCICGGMWLEL